MAQVLTSTAREYGDLGSGDMSGAMQQTARMPGLRDTAIIPGILKIGVATMALRDNKLLLQKLQKTTLNFIRELHLL